MAEEAGELATCPGCGQEVKLHSMIPVLDGNGPGHRYLCRPCARALIPAGEGGDGGGGGSDHHQAPPAEGGVAPD